jgi:hypothetical protein
MKKVLYYILPLALFSGINEDRTLGPLDSGQITFEWLSNGAVLDHDTHHVLVFQKIFDVLKVRVMMEFGLGYSTKYFLDHVGKVISIDFITHGYGPDTMKKFLHVYRDYSNWIPIAMFSGYRGWDYDWAPYKHLASESIYKATSYANAYHKSYAKVDDFYIVELRAFLDKFLKYNKVEIAFVGHATYIRGELIQMLFGKVPVLVAHNTDRRQQKNQDDPYNLILVETPDSYEEIFIPTQGGTTVWIEKKEKYKALYQELKQLTQMREAGF